MRGHVFGRAAHSLISLDGDAPHPVALEARVVSWLDPDHAAAVLARGVVAIVDVHTGRSIALPVPALSDQLVASDRAVMYPTGMADRDRVVTWVTLELRVPHEPAALQRWLADVSNARQSDGHAAQWP
jgi:hypothetical protein